MASHCEHWKRAPFFSPEKKELSLSNQECNSSLSVWCLGCWFNGFLGQPSLSATGDPLAFIPSDSAILLHSSPGSGYHRSRTILTLPAQRIGTVALCCHCLCGVWNVLFLSLLLLIHLQNLRGGGQVKAFFWSWGWGVTCMSSTSLYEEVGTMSSLDPFLFPAPCQCPTEFLTNMGTYPATYWKINFIAIGDKGRTYS